MTAITDVVDLEVRGRIALVTIDNPPVNALARGVRDGLFEAMTRARDDAAVEAVVIVCQGRTFIAGADIREFGKPPEGRIIFEAQDAIESSPKPVVAAIHGTALGGGLEVALCCHYRVAVESASFGLPEVKLGILPGAGGTQRLPRVVGVEKALSMMTSGNPIGANEALAAGLIDEIVSGDLTERAVAYAEEVVAQGRPLNKVRDSNHKLDVVKGKPEVFDDFRKGIARQTRGFLAPETIVQCVEAAVNRPFDEAIHFERKQFVKLVTSHHSIAQRYCFFAERQANKIPDVPRDTPQTPIHKVGIIGAGTMGGGISMNFANAGIPVTIVEVKPEALDRGLSVVRKNYERSASRGRISQQDVEERMARIHGVLNIESLADCDLVIEAVFENMDLKKDLFRKLGDLCKDGAILATNTSALDVDEIAAASGRPQAVIGLHFFSPANVMKLIEIVRGNETSGSAIATCMALAKKVGKVAVLVGVCRGFVGNRMLFARTVQSGKLILQGALPWDVDRVLYDFGFPMGPFAMNDLAGLDIGWNPKTSKGETLRDRLCEMGRRGQKTGAGYYNYDPETRERTPEPEVAALIRDYAKEKGVALRDIDDEEILQRCLFPMVNEAAKILEEGIAIRPSDIDVVWVNGYGWPQYRGGPVFWADSVGLDTVVARMKEFQKQDGGDRFWQPAALLERLAREGKGFKDL
jgi:3-hydroxyacyl-CoA dehydrogenase